MGSRRNIGIQQDEGWVWIYTHWGAERMLPIVQRALIRGNERWSDPSYLARIVFCQLLHDESARGQDVIGRYPGLLMSTTSLGISTEPSDWNMPHIMLGSAGAVQIGFDWGHPKNQAWSFDQFITLSAQQLAEADNTAPIG